MSEPGARIAISAEGVAAAAAAAVAPDPVTAQLLAKHSAGVKLTPAEYGKMGAGIKKQGLLSKLFGGKSDAPGQPAPAGAVAPAQTSADGLAVVAIDAALCQRTTSAILKRLDAISVRWITGHASKAGAVGKTLDDFRGAASLPAPDRELIAELSPDILAELGVSPRQYPMITVAGILGLHGCNLYLAVQDLKEMQTKQRVEKLKEEGQRKAAETVDKVRKLSESATVTQPGVTLPAATLPGAEKI